MGDPVPKVSIIIPSYNHAEWISEALFGVFRQSLQDWELIIIDDASGDNSWKIIQQRIAEFKARQSAAPSGSKVSQNVIKCLRHSKNQGAASTLNEGLSLAQGDFIAILNSDDAWDVGRLEQLHQYATQHELDFLATGVRLWDRHSRLKNNSEYDWLKWYHSLYADWQKHQDFLHTLLRGNFLITTSNFFLRRSCYERHGGFAELRYVHDYEYALRLCNAGARMACVWDEVSLNYRLHGNNTILEKPLAAIQENMKMLLAYLPKLAPHLDASRLHALQAQLQDLRYYTCLEWKTEVHRRLVAKEQTLLPLIDDRDAWIKERDAIIRQQRQLIEDRDQWVADRDGWIQERDAHISRLQQELQLQQQWISERESWLTDRDEMISKRDQWIAERDQWIEEREAWIAERDQLLAALRAEHAAVLNSRSYRLGSWLMQPARYLRSWFQQRKWSPTHA